MNLNFCIFLSIYRKLQQKKGKESGLSTRTNLSDDENQTHVADDRSDLSDQPRKPNIIRRARTEPFISSQVTDTNKVFSGGLWRRLSWKYGKDTALSELESRPGE